MKESVEDLLILGLGWQGEYIKNYWQDELGKNVKATTRDGRNGTIKWALLAHYDYSEASIYSALPPAHNVIITFPLPSEMCGKELMEGYRKRSGDISPNFILLGSTRAFHGEAGNPWTSRFGPVNKNDSRIRAEDWFLLSGGVVLNLAGLWGGSRQPKNWIPDRIAPTKVALADKKSVHLIHGLDVARLTYAVTQDMTPGERWLVSDLRVYDWWLLVLDLDDSESAEERRRWVKELVSESSTFKSLPRDIMLEMDRAVNSKETWVRFGVFPIESISRPR